MNNIIPFNRSAAISDEAAAAAHVVAQIIVMNDLTPEMVGNAVSAFYAAIDDGSDDDSDGDVGLLSDD